MGLFSKLFYKVADPLLTIGGSPIKSAKAVFTKTKFKDVQKDFFAQSKFKQAQDFALNVAAFGGAATSVGRAAVVKSAKVLAPKLFGTVPRAATTLFAAGVISKSPSTRKFISGAPERLFTQGGNLGTFIEKPKAEKDKALEDTSVLEKVEDFGIKAGLVLAGAGLVTVVAPKVKDKVVDIFTKDQTPKELPIVSTSPVNSAPVGAAPISTSPILPETTTVSPTRKKSKRRRKPRVTNVKQSVRVNVVNRASNRRYINKGIYY